MTQEYEAMMDAMMDILMEENQKNFDRMVEEDERNDRNQ